VNTREKIWPLEELAGRLAKDKSDWIVVGGLFDPLTTGEAEVFATHSRPGRKLLAFVLESPEPLLSAEARAILVAALREVSGVAIGTAEDWLRLKAESRAAVVDELSAGRQRTAEFVEFVLQRQAVVMTAAGAS
jgi:hypothetical protein